MIQGQLGSWSMAGVVRCRPAALPVPRGRTIVGASNTGADAPRFPLGNHGIRSTERLVSSAAYAVWRGSTAARWQVRGRRNYSRGVRTVPRGTPCRNVEPKPGGNQQHGIRNTGNIKDAWPATWA